MNPRGARFSSVFLFPDQLRRKGTGARGWGCSGAGRCTSDVPSPGQPSCAWEGAGSCEAAAGPGGKRGSGGNDCEPHAKARLRTWTCPQHLRGGSSAIMGPLRWCQCLTWNKRCVWLAVCGSPGGTWHLTPMSVAAKPELSTACGHLHPYPRVSLLPGCFCVHPVLPSARSLSGPQGLWRRVVHSEGGWLWEEGCGRNWPLALCPPSHYGIPAWSSRWNQKWVQDSPCAHAPPPPPGKAWSGGWRRPQMWGTSGGHQSS